MSTRVNTIEDLTVVTFPQRSIVGQEPTVFADIYEDDINIAVWQRELTDELAQTVKYILDTKPGLQLSATVTPQNAHNAISNALPDTPATAALCDDISQLVDMFCSLFDLEQAGLRLVVLDRAMCPRFHVDRVPCRLVTTYQGIATQWLPHDFVDRTKLGTGNEGLPDEQSGLFQQAADIQQLNQGDVALLKGESWQGNAGAGLVHRSPHVADARRMLLTLDFVTD